MKVYYSSGLKRIELEPGQVYRTVPTISSLILELSKNEPDYTIIYNGTRVNSKKLELDCNDAIELIIEQSGEQYTYSVKPSVPVMSYDNAIAYEQFNFEYSHKKKDDIESIQTGETKMYAVEQIASIQDWSSIFDIIEESFKSFKFICNNPKSHLKATNEVRPIETVKRVGYEAIPYLASHSEDWLARTASGLKPARLFSRVEDDEFQIYENRVVKTLIDIVINFLRKNEKLLSDKKGQLEGISKAKAEVTSFGFDVSFQKAINELIHDDVESLDYRAGEILLAGKLQKKAKLLLKKYRTLRQTRLYRYLKKTKPVANPLLETNILSMDKHYSVVYGLWKIMDKLQKQNVKDEKDEIPFDDLCADYNLYCKTLCGYTAHIMGFTFIEDNHYYRYTDDIDMKILEENENYIKVIFADKTKRKVQVPSNISIPIKVNEKWNKFGFDGKTLCWENDITADDIDDFCNLFKDKNKKGKEASEAKKKYLELKAFISEKNHSFAPASINCFGVLPMAVELSVESKITFTDEMRNIAEKLIQEDDRVKHIMVALPVCSENEQKVIEYAKQDNQKILFLPLSMFDINSYRRIKMLCLGTYLCWTEVHV